jgi:glutaredoxin 3
LPIVVDIIIYTKDYCPYCKKAKELLNSKGAKFTEIDVTQDADKLKEMVVRSGLKTVPQIFINGQHIGGCDDLFELEEDLKLDELLRS